MQIWCGDGSRSCAFPSAQLFSQSHSLTRAGEKKQQQTNWWETESDARALFVSLGGVKKEVCFPAHCTAAVTLHRNICAFCEAMYESRFSVKKKKVILNFGLHFVFLLQMERNKYMFKKKKQAMVKEQLYVAHVWLTSSAVGFESSSLPAYSPSHSWPVPFKGPVCRDLVASNGKKSYWKHSC